MWGQVAVTRANAILHKKISGSGKIYAFSVEIPIVHMTETIP